MKKKSNETSGNGTVLKTAKKAFKEREICTLNLKLFYVDGSSSFGKCPWKSW